MTPAAVPDPILEDEDCATPSLAARLNVTLGHPPRRFRAGEVTPAGIHWCLAPEAGANSDLGPDGLARTGLIPELDLPRRMWAGVSIEAFRPIRVGDRVVRRSEVATPVRKTGRGGPLAFCAITHEYRVGADLALRETQTIVYRPAARVEQNRDTATEPKRGVLLRTLEVDAAQLFRFSALTFNAHRIHLDDDFARNVEGYRDVLVHGTLTAALLLDAASSRIPPSKPWQATVRALAPAHRGPVEIRMGENRDGVELDAYCGAVRAMAVFIRGAAHPDATAPHHGEGAELPCRSGIGSESS